jgi:methionine-rich copper-binding protein CopC
MKKIIMFCLLALFINVQSVSAHSKLESSKPKEGETITGDVPEITLTFNTKIEELSSFTVAKGDGTDVKVENAAVNGSTLTGTVPKDLENGSYKINYKIVGEDSHIVEGSTTFILKREEPVKEEKPAGEVTKKEEKQKSETAEAKSTETEKEKSFLVPALIIAAAAVIGYSFIRRRNR